MKTISRFSFPIILAFVLCVGFVFTSCDEDKDEDKPYSELIIGRWGIQSQIMNQYENGQVINSDTTIFTTNEGEYVIANFNTSGIVTLQFTNGQADTSAYVVRNDSLIIDTDESFKILELNTSKLKIRGAYTDMNVTYENTMTFGKLN
ncbi:MAG: hypothetical protein H6Q15_70 [Bacteroidetes bacterium]|nr:hypothetical protein [Bacteroidota bacterium]